MDLFLDPSAAGGYRSPSQAARRMTERWAADNLFCLACPSDRVEAERVGTPVLDYRCLSCQAAYQLKSKSGAFGRTVQNSAYGPKMAAIERGDAPHYAFLRYSRDSLQVTDLFVVPGHFLVPEAVRSRHPLSDRAQRAGWVGSTIVLDALAPDARVQVVSNSAVRDPEAVRQEWARFAFLGKDKRALGGWGAEIWACVRRLQGETGSDEFSLRDFQARFHDELASRFPRNRHIEAKVRQQLQVLRDGGMLAFLRPGYYRLFVPSS